MLSNLFLISIVTPSLNRKVTVDQALDSVVSQSANYEYYILDGGSTDGTLDLLENYSKEFHQIKWFSESDAGQSSAINKGWRMANGEILAWLNTDDIYLPGALNIVSEYFQQHPDVDVVYGDCDYVDEAGHILGTYPTRLYNYASLIRLAINYIPQPATFIRRRVLESVGFLDESLHFVMDYDYWLRVGLQHKIAYIPVKLAQMRLHPNSKSVKNLAKFSQELITIYTKLFNTHDLPDSVRKLKREALHHAYYRAAHISFWAQDMKMSFGYAFRALRYSPFHLHALLLLVLANKIGFRTAKSFMSNPYLLGMESR